MSLDVDHECLILTPTPLEERIKKERSDQWRKMLVLAGPTGCGKTKLSLHLAEVLNGEIISADSMQIYRGMDIGTAKATLEDQVRIPHHMIDVRDINDPFNVVDFYYGAQGCIDKVLSKGKVPIIVGGAGFYLRALLYGPPAGPPSIPGVREQIEDDLAEFGATALYSRLTEKDPDYAATITPHDSQKIVRALEIIALTGETVSSLSWRSRPPSPQGNLRCWFLYRPRDVLYRRVEERCEKMIEEGFIEEVERLDSQGIRENRSAAHSIGYRQCLEFLDSERTDADFQRFMISFKQNSRHYVKRQFTWFRKEPLFRWLDVDSHDPEVLVDMMAKDFRLF